MKKIFTLLLCTIFVSAAFAQYDNRNWNRTGDYAYGDQGRGYAANSFFFYNGNRYCLDQRDEVIRQISADYDFRIQKVADNFFMSPWRKRDVIGRLQDEKAREINNIYAQCNNTYYPERSWRPHHHHDDDGD